MRRAAFIGLLVLASTLAILTAREVSIGQTESSLADRAAEAADWPVAIAHARAAAEAYVPGSPWPERGMRRLASVGHGAEARGDDTDALLAYGAMRTAAVSTHVPVASPSPWLAEANDGLARVAAAHEDVAHAPAAAQSMLDSLGHAQGPGDASLLVLALSAAVTISGLTALAFGPGGSRARLAGAIATGGFVAYAAVVLTR